MSRGVWFLAGTAAGAYGVSRLRRAAELLTVEGMHDRLTGLFAGARIFGEEVRAGMDEKETELRGRLAVASSGRPPDGPVLELAPQPDSTRDGQRGSDD